MALIGPQQALARAMSDISEYCWFARWVIGTDYHLWHFVVVRQDESAWGNYPVPQDSRAQLKRFSDEIGGWIWWPGQENDTAFIPISEWRTNLTAGSGSKTCIGRRPRRYVDDAEWFARQQGEER